jgi:hypothetical protein
MFNIQKFYIVATWNSCVLCGSENKQQIFPYASLTDWFCATKVESVYSVVWAYITQMCFIFKMLIHHHQQLAYETPTWPVPKPEWTILSQTKTCYQIIKSKDKKIWHL